MTAPTLWDVRTRLWEVFRDAAAADGGPARTAQVLEGSRVRGDTPELFLLVGAVAGIGADLAVLADDRWGRVVSAPDPMSAGWRIDEGEIDCVAVAWSGSADSLPQLRANASSLVRVCEAALVSNPRLGGLLDGENFAQVVGSEFRDPLTNKGPYAEVTFTVGYRARVVFS